MTDVKYFTRESLVEQMGKELVFDAESYPNYFSVCFKSVETSEVLVLNSFIKTVKHGNFLNWIFKNFTTIGFNNIGYDNLMVSAAVKGFTVPELHELSNRIIVDKVPYYQIRKEHKLDNIEIKYIDLMNVAFGKASLKLYAARMGTKKLQNLPYAPEKTLSAYEMKQVEKYCINDLDLTIELYKYLTKELELRRVMGKEYGVNLISKSDAQIAETVICSEIKQITGQWPFKVNPVEFGFKYNVPKFLNFKSDHLKKLLNDISKLTFHVNEKGSVDLPKLLQEKIRIGNKLYKIGIGGLHSVDKTGAYYSDNEFVIIDRDVTSYYPNIILNQNLNPQQLGENFLTIYSKLVDRRLKAKAEGNKSVNESLKIVINGTFGKFGDRYSRLYDPKLMIQTTITGQLSLLMLIDDIENADIEVISANTDGIAIKCKKSRYFELELIVKQWENKVHFKTEETIYNALFCRDVNNYMAIKTDGTIKRKGAFKAGTINKNPMSEICIDAAIAEITKVEPAADHILKCDDIKKFCCVRTVNGGAIKDGEELGKVIRWYYALRNYTPINYKISGNKVPDTAGAQPLMNLPDKMPDDIDYDWYIKKADSIMEEIGFRNSSKQQEYLFDY